MSANGFKGSTLQYSYTSVNYSPDNYVKPFTEQLGRDDDFIGFDGYNFGSINVENNSIRFDLDGIYTNIYFGLGHILEISDVGVDDVPGIIGFTLSTNIAGITSSDITFTSQSISIDVTSTSWDSGDYLEISVIFAKAPTPPTTKVIGSSGNDFLAGTGGRDLINGLAGNDTIFAGNDNDVVNGGAGDDVIGGGTGADKLSGDAGNDMLFGGNGDDQIFGGDGNDVAWGGKGADVVKGDAGDDLLGGSLGRDALYGGDGSDTLFGGADNDRLYGDAGNDTLYGGAGDDALTGGKGNDLLSGGAGADTFIFGKNEGDDVIRDFNGKDGDQIDVGNETYDIVENKDGFAVLELSGGGSITLNGIAIDDVDAGWFLAA